MLSICTFIFFILNTPQPLKTIIMIKTMTLKVISFQSSCGKSPPAEDATEKMQTECSTEGALSITDYSPEWAYPEGGAKVLVAGPWTETSDQYTVLFDNFPVPSILVQNGLLRCYCPGEL